MTDALHQDEPVAIQLPRVLLLWWSLWLLASWAQAFMWRWSLVSSPQSYTAALQNMLLSIGFGLVIVWPLFRLSLPAPESARRLAIVDWFALMGTLQVVIWPTRMTTQWSLPRVLLADVLIAGWALVLAGLLAWALVVSSRWQRIGWMLVVMCIAGLAPLIWLLTGTTQSSAYHDEWLFWSPVSMMWLMGKHAHVLHATSLDWCRAGLIWVVAGLVWLAVWLRPGSTSSIGEGNAVGSVPG